MNINPLSKLAVGVICSFALLPLLSKAQVNDSVTSSNKILFHVTFPYYPSNWTDTFYLKYRNSDGGLINHGFAEAAVISNLLAGSMYVHLMHQNYPQLQFDRTYMVGTILGQLLQETGLDDTRLNPQFGINDDINNPQKKAKYLAPESGESGGPYQINDYSMMLPFSNAQGGLGLVNYDAVRRSLGYSIADQNNGAQTEREAPDSLDNMYFSPMVTAFFQFNDVNRLNVESKASWYGFRDDWNRCWQKLNKADYATNANGLRMTDFIMDVIYNAGDFSAVFKSYLDVCNNQDPSQLSSLNDYSLNTTDYRAALGTKDNSGDSYYLYPRQVSFYVDQLFGKDLSAYGVEFKNNVILPIKDIKAVFIKSITQLSYKPDQKKNIEPLTFINKKVANRAFNMAIKQNKLLDVHKFSLADKDERTHLFNLFDDAISNVESILKIKFSATSDSD